MKPNSYFGHYGFGLIGLSRIEFESYIIYEGEAFRMILVNV